MQKRIIQVLPILVIIILILLIYKLGFIDYLTFATIKKHHSNLIEYTRNNYLLAIIFFVLTYIVIIALSVPGVIMLAILSGLLFGPYVGTALAVISSSIGALIPYSVVKLAFSDYVRRKFLKKSIEQTLQGNQFFYLLSLRFLPIIPFWLVNLIAGAFNVKWHTFFLATLLGIIPISFIYASIGVSLSSVIQKSVNLSIKDFFEMKIAIALSILALLSLLPTIIRKSNKKN